MTPCGHLNAVCADVNRAESRDGLKTASGTRLPTDTIDQEPSPDASLLRARAVPKPRQRRMLNRQRILLSIIDAAGGQVSHTELTKWAFVLREESPSKGGSAFFQFLPYKFGPFSFALFHEMGCLIRDGYATDSNQKWALTTAGMDAMRSAEPSVRADVDATVRRLAGKKREELIEYVYSRYPWYTINSELGPREVRAKAERCIYTAGYEGLQIDGFLNALLRAGIERLIDVRNNPVSRRYGFHRSTLDRISKSLGLDYQHFPQLGIHSDKRDGLGVSVSHVDLFDRYEREVIPQESTAISDVAALMTERPSVLVCMEARHCECHRSRLSAAVAVRSRLSVSHLVLAA